MIDPISVLLRKGIEVNVVEFPYRGEIGAEQFFGSHQSPASFAGFVQACGFQVREDRFKLVRSSRKVKKPIAARAAFLVDLVETFRQSLVAGLVSKFALMIKD